MILTSPTGNTTPSSILAVANDWRTAATDLIAWLVANDRCFSSGEVAAYIRTNRPDLKLAATNLGEFLRTEYDNGTFPFYVFDDGIGGTMGTYPTQVPRTTIGTSRTLDGRTVASKSPAGTTVFVYAPDSSAGFAHDFEIYIPDWNDPQALTARLPSAGQSAAALSATPQAPVVTASGALAQPPVAAIATVITGSLKKDDLTAYVRPDRRLCVPRAAFEAFVSLTGIPLRGGQNGDPIYIDFTNGGTVVKITREQNAGQTGTEYHLWTGRGRVAFLSGAGVTPFDPGDKYTVDVTGQALSIDLTNKV